MINIPGYEIGEEIYNGLRTVVYRGIREKDRKAVVIKLLKNPLPSFHELLQFRNQYTIAKNLDIPGIVCPCALESYQNSYMLVMEDTKGISLRQYLRNDCIISIVDVLSVALQLTNILQHLHQNYVIHKDIKPDNILINPETKEIKLIDFSIASLLSKENQEVKNPHTLEGTLAYISPEQTGRMNRGIDYRADFYALGVTLFELISGELPFQSHDPMELIYSHIATPTPELEKKEIPQVLSDIVIKLMAKNAEDRYQSAFGLKHDLEKCLNQLKDEGRIENFEIGKLDICDRFNIPEKLYGREKEVEDLLSAFDRVLNGEAELFLVSGFSGIGKTAVINEVHKPIVKRRGYFIKGKFDQFNRNIPFSAFVQAFQDLTEQLLSESDTELSKWKEKILNALGDNAQVIIDIIPQLERILGKQPPVMKLSGNAAQNRFNLLFKKFIQVFACREHPLVIFLDDLQWSDSASLNLIELLMSDYETSNLLLIGAYRDNEVFPTHPFILTLEEIRKHKETIHTIHLKPLDKTSLNQMVYETLNCNPEVSRPLTDSVYQKTQGNPFFSTQFLKFLHEDGLIRFNVEKGLWEWEINAVRELAIPCSGVGKAIADDVVDFMALQLQKLPATTQNVLTLAACVGNKFDLATISSVCQQSEAQTAADLWKALQIGLILPQSQVYKFYLSSESQKQKLEDSQILNYKFLHDRVQQAAYSLITEKQRQITHYQIGKIILKNISQQEREERIFELVNHLNHGIYLIAESTDKLDNSREKLAQLNLIACRKARNNTAYQAGLKYVNFGLSLLGENAWKTDSSSTNLSRYEMILDFYNLGAELASLCGDLERMDKFIETVIQKADSLADKVKVYRIKILSNVSQNKLTEAINIALDILQQFGVNFPELPTSEDIQQAMGEIDELIGDRQVTDLVNLPKMQDREKIAIIQIANSVAPAAYISGSPLLPLLYCLPVKLSIIYGNISNSINAYVCYGIIVCNLKKDIESGVSFGNLALELADKSNDKIEAAAALSVSSLFLFHRKSHLKNTFSLLQEGYTKALEVGNLEYVGYIVHQFCLYSFWSSQPLVNLEKENRNYCGILTKYNQLIILNWCCIYWQQTLNLLGTTEDPTLLIGEALNEIEFLPQLIDSNDSLGIYSFHLCKLMLCYLFGDIKSAQHNSSKSREYLMAGLGIVGEPIFYFYDSLIAIADLDNQPNNTEKLSQSLERVEKNQNKLRKDWANYASMNYQHKVDLVEAEKYRILGDFAKAIEFYDKAIAGAKVNEYLNEEALANELAAKFYLNWGKHRIAADYILEAYHCYEYWGAKAKTEDLEKRYPDLLRLKLQQNFPILDSLNTLNATAKIDVSIHSSSSRSSSSTTNISSSLDFAAILKASQALSRTIELDVLQSELAQIILQNSGGDRTALILPHENQWRVETIATPHHTQLCSRILEECSNLPAKLIHYVKNSHKVVIINDLTTDLPIIDEYLATEKPRSILCLPLLNQAKLIGILYLENSSTSNVFSSDRVLILNFLCTQAAISLENARLYAQERQKTWEIAQKEAEYRSIFESVNDGLSICDLEAGKLIAINPAYERIYDFTPEEWLQLTPKDFIHEDDVYHFGNYLENIRSGKEFYTQCVGKRKDGSYFDIEVKAVPFMYKGKLHGLSVIRDISEQKKAQTSIRQKSEELGKALQELQHAQLQMVQNEKMASLGNLVAGVAHEVNNPIGFIKGSINNAKEYSQDIISHLELYQKTYPQVTQEIEENAEDIDLEFLLEDFPKLLDSMTGAVQRIKSISNSLRTFSRADTDSKILANLHDGIDSTLLILKYRLKASDIRPAIQINKEYAQIPQIQCFPGQLNQVFMNILANAIDMFDEMAQNQTWEELEAKPQHITITTNLHNEQVFISIKDNGKGMNEEIQSKIFQYLFTTKEVGKGTGLGLAIARQIIEEKHNGSIKVYSEIGCGTEFLIRLPIFE